MSNSFIRSTSNQGNVSSSNNGGNPSSSTGGASASSNSNPVVINYNGGLPPNPILSTSPSLATITLTPVVISHVEGLSKNLKEYVNSSSLSDVSFIVGPQRDKVCNFAMVSIATGVDVM